jgi:hypothetical protein
MKWACRETAPRDALRGTVGSLPGGEGRSQLPRVHDGEFTSIWMLAPAPPLWAATLNADQRITEQGRQN